MKTFILLMLFVLACAFSAAGQATKTLILPRPVPPPPPPGNIEMIRGYEHIERRGVDASVGEIAKPGGMTISYLIGPNAELATDRLCGGKDSCLWLKRQTINGRKVRLGLTKEGQAAATFPQERANFYADIKSPEDLADFLIMVLTYRAAASPPTAEKAKTKKQK